MDCALDPKAFCGEDGGIVCTSPNARSILEWLFAQRDKVLFFPDRYLGRWSVYSIGVAPDQMQL
jgi:quinolinate synthase